MFDVPFATTSIIAVGPMPEFIRIRGELMAPAARMTRPVDPMETMLRTLVCVFSISTPVT